MKLFTVASLIKRIIQVVLKLITRDSQGTPKSTRTFIGFATRKILTRQDVELAITRNDGPDSLDLSGCDFSGADLSGISFISSPTVPQPSSGSMSSLNSSVFRGPRMRNASFIEANLSNTRLHGSDLSGSWFYKANLRNAELSVTNLSNADLTRADLRGADLYLARLSGAILHEAKLEGADLTRALLNSAYITGVETIGKYLVQENAEEYRQYLSRYRNELGDEWFEKTFQKRYYRASKIYRELEQCFNRSGNYDAASWAYRKARRMEKIWSGQQVLRAWKYNKGMAISYAYHWAISWLVELLCDYGESVKRVICWIVATIFVIGPIAACLLGGLYWTGENKTIYVSLPTTGQRAIYAYFQNVLYMIDTFTTSDFAALEPANDAVRLVSGLLALIGIFLAGLLGFVAGNRIRHS